MKNIIIDASVSPAVVVSLDTPDKDEIVDGKVVTRGVQTLVMQYALANPTAKLIVCAEGQHAGIAAIEAVRGAIPLQAVRMPDGTFASPEYVAQQNLLSMVPQDLVIGEEPSKVSTVEPTDDKPNAGKRPHK